ncbi:Flagellin [Halomonas sp. THAF5a]|uniref:flagellin N-terminal helical domain-containing protein n=1 Tax=Halomonas sp. THAF5a TaxID=2587844 RepID=UPI0012AAA8AD|nr:flagellin [Halomonas sp. THAF5a]QFU00146.1 Flagellin [Halomonas sp. THAF5a]
MASIQTNLLALKGHQHQLRARSSLSSAMERLSSGLRINSAKDDAAGLGIGNRMTSQIRGQAQVQRNANDGISVAQTAEGALDQINQRLQRIRELTVQGLNGSLKLRDTDVIQAEINANLEEIDRLAENARFNGMPLLTGRAGEVGLQVGANDGETLDIDLTPPGFSVEELGLEEFTIAGIDGEVTDRNTLMGRARDIHLDDTAHTSISYAGMGGSNHDLKRIPSTDNPGNDHTGYYVSAVSSGGPVLYDVNVQAEHDTASDTSSVSFRSVRQIYSEAGTLSTDYLASSDITITDSGGNAFSDGASRRVVKDGDTYLVEETDANGIVRHYETELKYTVDDSSPTATTMEVRQAATPLPGPDTPPAAITSGTVNGYDLDAADTLEYVDEGGNSLTDGELVQVDGDYYLRATESDNGDSVYYALNSIQETTTGPPATTTLTFQADTSQGHLDPELANDTSSTIRTPAISVSGEMVALQDGNGDPLPGATRLMERNDAGHQDEYVIEVDEGGGVYSYYRAELTVSADGDGNPSALSAQAIDGSPYATFRTDEADDHNVQTVSGTTTVTIDPRNVEVNYTDADGEVHNDVLRSGSEGDSNYYFDLPNSQSEYGSFKIASLVNSEDNDILIKTINGNGEVIIYHPSNLNSSFNVSVTTDANGFGNGDEVSNGTPHTIINIVEDAQEIRLKKPKNPLAALDRAIGYVDSKRGHLGAITNRLDNVVDSSQRVETQLSSARSRIMDANYAKEVASMTKAQILQQAGTTLLAQANQLPQNALSLLS